MLFKGQVKRIIANMPAATHIIRFIANEDHRVHIGQLVDTKRDVGLDSVEGKEIKAYLINGSIFDGEVTDKVYTVKQLLSPVSMEDCNFIRCLGLNYMDHAKVSDCDLSVARTALTGLAGSKHGAPESSHPLRQAPNSARRSIPWNYPRTKSSPGWYE